MDLKILFVLVNLILLSLQNRIEILDDVNQKKEIIFSIADFGDVPYGQSVIGNVEVANPINACQNVEHYNITKISNSIIPIAFIQSESFQGDQGDCHIVDKVRNVEMAGYKLVIIELNVQQLDQIIMADDGRGSQIHIPAIFVNLKDGQFIRSLFNDEDETLHLRINFEVEQKEKSQVTFIFYPNDRLAQSFLLQFIPYLSAFETQVKFMFKYRFFVCEGCLQDQSKKHINCLGGGKYCLQDPDGYASPATGQMSGYEAIRQLCIFDLYGTRAYLEYLKNFYRFCPLERATEWEECSKKEQDLVEGVRSPNINLCFGIGWEKNSPKPLELQSNSIIDKFLPTQKELAYISNQNLGIRINNFTYFGKLNPYDVAEAICSSLLNPSSQCQQIMDGLRIKSDYQISEEELMQRNGMSVAAIVLITVAILIVIFVIILFIYKKLVNREMESEMKGQVNEMVTNYIKFYESKDKSKSGSNV